MSTSRPDRLTAVEVKLDALKDDVDRRFGKGEKRFDDIERAVSELKELVLTLRGVWKAIAWAAGVVGIALGAAGPYILRTIFN